MFRAGQWEPLGWVSPFRFAPRTLLEKDPNVPHALLPFPPTCRGAPTSPALTRAPPRSTRTRSSSRLASWGARAPSLASRVVLSERPFVASRVRARRSGRGGGGLGRVNRDARRGAGERKGRIPPGAALRTNAAAVAGPRSRHQGGRRPAPPAPARPGVEASWGGSSLRNSVSPPLSAATWRRWHWNMKLHLDSSLSAGPWLVFWSNPKWCGGFSNRNNYPYRLCRNDNLNLSLCPGRLCLPSGAQPAAPSGGLGRAGAGSRAGPGLGSETRCQGRKGRPRL